MGESTTRRVSSCVWRQWKGLAAVVGYVREARLPAETALPGIGRWSHSPGDTEGPTSQGTGACAGGAPGDRRCCPCSPVPSSPWLARPQPPLPVSLCPSQALGVTPSPATAAGQWVPSCAMSPWCCAQPLRSLGSLEQLGCSLQSHVAPVGLLPSIVPKSLCWSHGCSLPLTSGVLTHSCSWHFNPVKAIPSSDSNTATSCIRNPRYGIPPNPLLLSKAFTAFDLAHAVLGVGIVHSAR